MSKILTFGKYIISAGMMLPYVAAWAQGKIIMNGATMHMVNAVYVSTSDISIQSGAAVADSATIKISGAISNSGIFDLSNGTLEMNGAAPQTIPANSISNNIIRNLIVSNNFSLAGEDSVTGVLSFGASDKTLNTGGFLTLKSTAGGTARVADITNAGANSGNTIAGNVHVERYISPKRAWRLLTAPISTSGAQTINEAWQEGQTGTNNIPGFGTHITGGSEASGFDQGVRPENIAIQELTDGQWRGLTNTNSTPVTNRPGYMLFVRGDRSVNLSLGVYAPPISTVLRSTGSLKMNDQLYTVAATGYTLVANPYASPIDLNQIAKSNSTNIQDNFYLWDPKITGTNNVGGYVNVSWNGNAYDITPAGGSGLNQYIQSGSAFLATSANGSTPGQLIIKEGDKSPVNLNAYRPFHTSTAKLKTNLYSYNADGTISIVDGILNSYDSRYSNSLDNYDAVKINNFSESLSSLKNGVALVVERKPFINSADTIFLHMLQMKAKSYKFELSADNFNTGALTAVLEDSYTHASIPLDLAGTTIYNFDVINNPASWNPNRFRIVFMPSAVLPVTLKNVRAFMLNDDIKIEWNVEHEMNITQYEIERSSDGRHFVKANTLKAIGNNAGTRHYGWLDKNTYNGYNYYRLKVLDNSGEVKYSPVVKIYMGIYQPEIALFSNIVTDNAINFRMSNMRKGAYAVSITNSLGQTLYRNTIDHEEGSSTQTINIDNNNYPTGIYYLNIVKPDFTPVTLKLFVE